MTKVMEKSEAQGKFNVAYQAAYLLAIPDKCIEIMIKSKRIAEAAMFARAYCPSKLPEIIKTWNELLKAKDLPFQPEDLLTSATEGKIMEEALKLEKRLTEEFYGGERKPAAEYE
jgi:hypothetical protein